MNGAMYCAMNSMVSCDIIRTPVDVNDSALHLTVDAQIVAEHRLSDSESENHTSLDSHQMNGHSLPILMPTWLKTHMKVSPPLSCIVRTGMQIE